MTDPINAFPIGTTDATSFLTDAQAAKTGAETAQTAAEAAQTAAETAETNAETAQTGAQTAQTAAETAQTAAEDAQSAAETARTGAETAQTAAETAQTAAEAAQTGAETAETNAESIVTDLGTLATAVSDAETAQAAAETAQTAAEAARDSAETYAGVVARATSEANLIANYDPTGLTAGDLGIVSGSGDPDEDGLWEVQANTPNEWVRVGDSGVSGLRADMNRTLNHEVDPFPIVAWEPPMFWRFLDVQTPSSGLTSDETGITIANSGRFFGDPVLSDLDLSVGDTIRVAFRLLSGSDYPSAIQFKDATNTLLSSLSFTLQGGWYVAEGAIPTSTNELELDFSNSTGSDIKISRPQIAKRATDRDRVLPTRACLERISTDPGSKSNLWPSSVAIAKTGGGGSLASVVNTGDGTVQFPADFIGQIMGEGINRDVADELTILMKSSSRLIRQVDVRFVGATSGTTTDRMKDLGDGWWYWSGEIPTISGSTAIDAVYFEPDNRDSGNDGYSSAAVTFSSFIVVDGLEVPDRLPSAASGYDPDEIVINQASDEITISQDAGGQHITWTFSRYNDSGTRALGWRITDLSTATRTGDTTMSAGSQIANSGEYEVAIKESGKSDFMGGSTHGDMEEDQDLIFLVDGQIVTPDGSTPYRATRVEAIQKASLWEVDNVTDTLTATLVTRWVWEKGELRLFHRLEWARSITVTTDYLTMLPIMRYLGGGASGTLLSSDIYKAPEYGSEDISAASHGMAQGNYPRLFTVGDASVLADVEIVEGWSTDARSFAEDDATRNKIYFWPAQGSVTAGDILEWEAVYRISVS